MNEYTTLQQSNILEDRENSLPAIFGKRFDIIIPAYNEEKRIRPVLDDICQFISKNQLPWKVVVAIDGNDGTIDIVREFSSRYLFISYLASNGRGGKGAAIKRSTSMIGSDYVILIDADNSIKFDQIVERIPLMEKYDVVILSRYNDTNEIPALRRIISRGFNFLVRTMTGLNVSDTQSGYKMFRSNEFLEALGKVGATNTFYDISLLYHLQKDGNVIHEIDTPYTHDNGSKFNPFAEIIGQGVSLVAFLVRHSRFYPYVPEFLIDLYKRKFRWI